MRVVTVAAGFSYLSSMVRSVVFVTVALRLGRARARGGCGHPLAIASIGLGLVRAPGAASIAGRGSLSGFYEDPPSSRRRTPNPGLYARDQIACTAEATLKCREADHAENLSMFFEMSNPARRRPGSLLLRRHHAGVSGQSARQRHFVARPCARPDYSPDAGAVFANREIRSTISPANVAAHANSAT